MPVLTYTCIPEEVDIGSEYSSVPSYSYGYYDDLDDNGVNIKKYPDGVERRGSTKVADDDQWDEFARAGQDLEAGVRLGIDE